MRFSLVRVFSAYVFVHDVKLRVKLRIENVCQN